MRNSNNPQWLKGRIAYFEREVAKGLDELYAFVASPKFREAKASSKALEDVEKLITNIKNFDDLAAKAEYRLAELEGEAQ